MGATASQCAHACCSCCLSSTTRGSGSTHKGDKSDGRSASATRDQDDDSEADSWLQKGKVPLLSARHDREIVDEGVVVRKVVVARLPTPTHHSASQVANSRSSPSPSSPKRGLRAVAAENRVSSPVRSPRHGSHHDDSPNSSNEDGSWELASPGHEETNMLSPNARMDESGGSSDDEMEETKAEPRRTARSQRSASAASHGSPRGGEDAADTEFDEETKGGSPRSPRSPSRPSSGSTSPKRKERYGRKNYRADSSRKKTM